MSETILDYLNTFYCDECESTVDAVVDCVECEMSYCIAKCDNEEHNANNNNLHHQRIPRQHNDEENSEYTQLYEAELKKAEEETIDFMTDLVEMEDEAKDDEEDIEMNGQH